MRIRMVGGTINSKEIDRRVAKSKAFQKEAHKMANKKLAKAKHKMIQEFNSHPVTQELEGGKDATNISKTLSGYGNLFSFMGFGSGAKPTGAVRQFLQSSIDLKLKGKATSLVKEFSVNVPTLEDFNFALMPWESGNSWVKSVEKGMSSFSYYMHKAHEASRSGAGIQIDNRLRNSSSVPVRYISLILDNFRKRLTK